MIITLGGTPGSGKSTVAKLLAKKLGYQHHSTGDFMREMAYERRITLLELGKLAEEDRGIDEELDQWQIGLRKEDNFVIDSRLGYHFMPDSIKIFLDADFEERSKRILGDMIRKEHHVDLDGTKENINRREYSEKKRYTEYYDLDPWDKENYDLVVDTTNMTPEQVVDEVLAFIKNKNL